MSKFLRTVLLLIGFALCAQTANAHTYLVRFGPAGVGMGGTNPLGIPPTIADVELSMHSKSDFEYNVAITWLTFGHRFYKTKDFYLSAGAGLILSLSGLTPGVYTAVGSDIRLGKRSVLNFEYKQGLGIGGSPLTLISPYAIRIGYGLCFK